MSNTQVKVKSSLHEKMKGVGAKKRLNVRETYEEAINDYLKKSAEDEIIKESEVENFLNKRIGKAEDHLASMMARTGMDTSMVLMGILTLLEKLLKVERSELQEYLRKNGAVYFKSSIREDKEKKREANKNKG